MKDTLESNRLQVSNQSHRPVFVSGNVPGNRREIPGIKRTVGDRNGQEVGRDLDGRRFSGAGQSGSGYRLGEGADDQYATQDAMKSPVLLTNGRNQLQEIQTPPNNASNHVREEPHVSLRKIITHREGLDRVLLQLVCIGIGQPLVELVDVVLPVPEFPEDQPTQSHCPCDKNEKHLAVHHKSSSAVPCGRPSGEALTAAAAVVFVVIVAIHFIPREYLPCGLALRMKN
mmetsp:Transcript_26442/g.55567  ORF Transcript_26442/g.55567 Transcript_26442/m.55567 type:complete len:229 (+) Transcript_26442:2122-2808(+)